MLWNVPRMLFMTSKGWRSWWSDFTSIWVVMGICMQYTTSITSHLPRWFDDDGNYSPISSPAAHDVCKIIYNGTIHKTKICKHSKATIYTYWYEDHKDCLTNPRYISMNDKHTISISLAHQVYIHQLIDDG